MHWFLHSVCGWLTAVPYCTQNMNYTKNSIFWDITPYVPLLVSPRFGGTYRLHLQGRRINQARNQHKAVSKLTSCWFLSTTSNSAWITCFTTNINLSILRVGTLYARALTSYLKLLNWISVWQSKQHNTSWPSIAAQNVACTRYRSYLCISGSHSGAHEEAVRLKVIRRLVYCLHFQDWRINQAKRTWFLLHAGFLLGFLSNPEEESVVFSRNIDWFSTDFMTLYPKRQSSAPLFILGRFRVQILDPI
jgi:hypothetical protein